ncbi:putative fatty acyl-CoA reductase CG5065 [Copidosoma floridanum]|uniref:putative fatty acyl-CoA reductase CG5065 n=1 Tax=Copidosoma floridanum TaxID=29053 RepID=UPI0006C9D703|nr:putative fatty acyl-CoA reductase CG5065 [Copidosoma floridanum]
MSLNRVDPTTSIPAFYAGRSILVTGGTGFMGKVLIEKLLWSCPDIQEIFLLMRPKKDMSIDERLKKMLGLPLFDRLRENRPRAFEKLIPVTGDTTEEGLGLPPIERQYLIDRVSIVFHVAASVRFDDSLKNAIFMNTRSTRDVCILAASMKQLVALVHVSSTYSHTDKYCVEEKIYPFEMDWKKAIRIAETVDDHTLRILTPKILDCFPNTYTFTKRLAEGVVADYAGVLPIVVFRPSIVISAILEPLGGWLDNFNGPVGLMIGGGKGVLRVTWLDGHKTADFIPVDVAIKAMITAAWKRGIVTITKDPNIAVYNCSASDRKSISMSEIVEMGLLHTKDIPLEGILWIPNITISTNKFVYYILTMLLHILPALMIDSILKVSGRKPMLLKLQRKVYVANNALHYFLTNEWKFMNAKMHNLLVDTPPADLDSFGFEYASFDIYNYFKTCIVGAKKYLLHENMNRLDDARKHYNRMHLIDRFFKIWLGAMLAWLLVRCGVLGLLFSSYRSTVETFTG